jgi:hypothetical protein
MAETAARRGAHDITDAGTTTITEMSARLADNVTCQMFIRETETTCGEPATWWMYADCIGHGLLVCSGHHAMKAQQMQDVTALCRICEQPPLSHWHFRLL